MGVRGPTRQPEGCLAPPPLGHARHPPGCLVALLGALSRLYDLTGVKNLEQEEFQSFTAASWRKPTEKKNPYPAGRFRRGDHLLEGEIVAIVTIIVTGIIEIIINIIPNFSTITPSSHLIPTIEIRVVLHVIH